MGRGMDGNDLADVIVFCAPDLAFSIALANNAYWKYICNDLY